MIEHRMYNSSEDIPVESMCEFLMYDQDSTTGLRWINDSGQGGKTRKFLAEAGYFDKGTGYFRLKFNGRRYQNHRVVLALHGIYLGKYRVDHIDRNRANNKIENLRIVTIQENSYNRTLNINNKTEYAGVSWNQSGSGRWVTNWNVNGKQKYKYFHPSNYNSVEEALSAAILFRKQMIDKLYMVNPNSAENICLWPDNTQCYRYELHEMQHMSDDFIVVPYGSLFYPDGITIIELDYDAVVKGRSLALGLCK